VTLIVKASVPPNERDNLPVTITVSLPIGKWKLIQKSLAAQNYPSSSLADAIGRALDRVAATIYEEQEGEGW
jgi:hypothetical protein